LFVPARTAAEAARDAADADAVLGFCTPEVLKSGARLRWIDAEQVGGATAGIAVTSLAAGLPGETRWLVLRENVRRFVAGEPLLGVVRSNND
jgi:hypothetical protein